MKMRIQTRNLLAQLPNPMRLLLISSTELPDFFELEYILTQDEKDLIAEEHPDIRLALSDYEWEFFTVLFKHLGSKSSTRAFYNLVRPHSGDYSRKQMDNLVAHAMMILRKKLLPFKLGIKTIKNTQFTAGGYLLEKK